MKENKRDVKNKDELLVKSVKECGFITCMHNMHNTCNEKKCEIYERSLLQEY